MSLSAEERETIITTDDSLDVWDIYTNQRKIMTKIEKLGVSPYKTETDKEGNIISKSYKLGYKQISFRKIVELTEEQKEKKRELAKQMAEKRQNQNLKENE